MNIFRLLQAVYRDVLKKDIDDVQNDINYDLSTHCSDSFFYQPANLFLLFILNYRQVSVNVKSW